MTIDTGLQQKKECYAFTALKQFKEFEDLVHKCEREDIFNIRQLLYILSP